DPSIGSFKAWLLTMTRWRIIAQFRKQPALAPYAGQHQSPTSRTAPIDKLADPNGRSLEEVWEAEWEANLVEAALKNIKRRFDPLKFQIFDFYVNKEWEPDKVAERFGVAVGQVYQIKHRVTA